MKRLRLNTVIPVIENIEGISHINLDLPQTFRSELLNDVRLEFVEEGQIFLYCKKLNVAPNAWDTSDSFRETWWYFPMPENETIF